MGDYEDIGAHPGGRAAPVEEVKGYIINTDHSGSLQWFLPMSAIPETIETSLVLLYVCYPFLSDLESASGLLEVLLYRR